MPGPTGLARLLAPKSIAIVGASDRVGPGFNAFRALEQVGYEGEVFLVNPKRTSLFDRPTFPSVEAIPRPIDAVFVAVPREAVPAVLEQAAAKGAGGAAVLTGGFAEAGPEGAAAQARLVAVAETSGLAVCGPNCLGLIGPAARSALWGTALPERIAPGPVAAVVQSGSAGIALLNADRGLGLAYLVTSGNEAVTTAADYIDVLAEDPEVRVVVAFLEQLRRPDRFVAAARKARALGKPVIVLKTGRSERGRLAAAAHTGAVAGRDEVCDAAFRAAGVIRVASLDELIETAVLAAASPRAPAATGVAMLSPSGGEIALALDVAEAASLELPALDGARPALEAILPEFANVGNPLDLTWAGLYDPAVARRCAEILGSQPDVGLLVLLQDAPRGLGPQQASRYAAVLTGVAAGAAAAGKPLVVVSNLAGDLHPAFEAAARDAGAPCLRGTQEGLFAVARLARWAAAPSGEEAGVRDGAAAGAAASRLAAVPPSRPPTEPEARRILEAYGIEGPREAVVATADQAVAAARALGYPVVLKGIAEGVLHKTEAGLVEVGLRSDAEVREAARAMLGSRAAPAALLVQEMVRPVAELLVGGRVEPDFGPVVVAGGGGVLVELYRDAAVRLAPVSETTALEMLAETRALRLLSGFRGRPRGDLAAVARVIAAVSRFVADFRDRVAEVEINPAAVLEEGRGVRALDCLIVPAGQAGGAR
ncbi:MAG TPA: acetate--CoA ligase family protein [Thermodesulfobacteriota bacterium]